MQGAGLGHALRGRYTAWVQGRKWGRKKKGARAPYNVPSVRFLTPDARVIRQPKVSCTILLYQLWAYSTSRLSAKSGASDGVRPPAPSTPAMVEPSSLRR